MNAFITLQNRFMNSLTTEVFYVQVSAILLAIVGAILISGTIRRYGISQLIEKTRNELGKKAIKKLSSLITPFMLIILLGVGYNVASEVPVSTAIIIGCTKLAYVWFITKVILLVISNRLVAVFISFTALVIAALQVTDTLEYTIKFLSSISFTFGTIKVTMLGICKGVIFFVVLFWLARSLTKFIEHILRKSTSLHYNSRELIIKFSNIFFYFVAFVATLNVVGVDLTALAVFGGALAVGIGFGLQKITSNFISGIILLFEDSVKAGDLIEVSGQSGWVRQSGIRYTMIETFDGREILVPNEELVTNRVTNWTLTNNRARAQLIINVSYDSDLKRAAELILETAKEHPRSLKDPEPTVFLHELGEKAAIFHLMFWIYDIKDGTARPKSDVLFAIRDKFEAAGIELAYPKRDMVVKLDTLVDAAIAAKQ